MGKRINPIEFVVFAIVATGFGVSAYRLFDGPPAFESSLLSPMASNPKSEIEREPAAVPPLFGHVDFGCKAGQESTVKASKIRISGPICGIDGGAQVESTAIINSANQFHATVFTDLSTGKFSTDYIPMNSEKNSILVEFKFKNGKTVSHQLLLHKE